MPNKLTPISTPSLAILGALLLAGCGQQLTPGASSHAIPVASGKVIGGQQPVSGASVQLYAVGTTGDQSAAAALLTPAITTDASGAFTLTSLYTCPTPTTLVYLVATGGNPGLASGTNNAAITLMAALGQCQTLLATNPIPYFVVNEVSTVSAVAALQKYISSPTHVGSGASDATALATAFTLASEFANTNNGTSPGNGVPANLSANTALINTLADIVATCVNSVGGVSGDGSPCGNLFADSNSPTVPTTVIGALLNIFANPNTNTAALLNLAPAVGAPFQPTLSIPPPNWTVSLMGTSQWVFYNNSGNLAYKPVPSSLIPDTNGFDTIMDFSTAGYMAGGTAIPSAPVALTLSPSGGDDTAAIQTAINTVSALTLNSTTGLRGAVLLNPGSYTVSSTLNLTASGVVLRGSGSGNSPSSNTVITMTAATTPYPFLNLGTSGTSPTYTSNTTTTVTDSYVPAGSLTLDVSNASIYSVGEEIMIKRPATSAWITFMQMNPTQIQPSGSCSSGTCNWISTSTSAFKTDRFITAINGNTITLDSPLSDSLDSAYLGSVAIQAFTFPTRTINSGVENFRVVTPVPATNLVPPTASYQVVVAYSAMNCWIRNLTSQDALQAIDIETYTKQLTVSNIALTHTVTQTDSAKFEDYYINGGTQILFDNVSDITDNMYFFSTSSSTQGPNVLRNASFTGNTNVEPHQRWATGLLVENTVVTGFSSGDPAGQINLWDRGDYGTGQGWAIGWGVVWNSTASGFTIQQPPGSENWCIGCTGPQIVTAAPGGATPGLGIFDSPGVPVFPVSLYQAQLTQRLGAGVVAQ